jgi:hypothetical protein
VNLVAKHLALALLCALAAMSTGCYESRLANANGAGMQSKLASSSGMTPAAQAQAGNSGAEPRGGDSSAPTPPAETPSQSMPRMGGTGGCGAILAPGASVTADGSAFKGIGGAGFDLVGICDRCGWAHETDACRSLVYTVPTIDSPGYRSCGEVPFSYVSCLESTSCICDGAVPDACRAFKDKLDACR